jgi:Holliday junction resolvase
MQRIISFSCSAGFISCRCKIIWLIIMSNKSIGLKKEWSLKRKLDSEGYLVMRSSASKTGIDILAGKASESGRELLAFQVQTSEYIYPEKVADLVRYAQAFGAQPFVALTRDRKWIFVRPDDLEKNGKMWKITLVAEEKRLPTDGRLQP